MDRRAFLVLGASVLGVAACTGDGEPDAGPDGSPVEPAPSQPPADDPDGPLRDRVAAAEAALIAQYRTVISERPRLADTLAPFLAHHEEHLARVAPGWAPGPVETPVPSASASAGPSGSAAPAPSGSAAPAPSGSAAEALDRLARAERDAGRDRIAACDAAASGVLARDLCLISASEAQHAAALERRGYRQRVAGGSP
jgi:hypothetical protein